MSNPSDKPNRMELYLRCDSAQDALETHARDTQKEIRERIKRVKAVKAAIKTETNIEELPLDGAPKISLPPETKALLHNPLHGLV